MAAYSLLSVAGGLLDRLVQSPPHICSRQPFFLLTDLLSKKEPLELLTLVLEHRTAIQTVRGGILFRFRSALSTTSPSHCGKCRRNRPMH